MSKAKARSKRSSRALSIVRKYFPTVTRVDDATKDENIVVTSRDCTTSKKRDLNGCALAVAAKRAYTADGVIVAIRTVYVVKDRRAMRFLVPESVSREIVAFDRNGDFEPGTYTLKKVPPYSQLGVEHGGHEDGSRAYYAAKSVSNRHVTGGIRTVLGHKEVRD